MSRSSLLSVEAASMGNTWTMASLLGHSIEHVVGIRAARQLASMVVTS
jgi:hypothetical protein